MLRSHALILWVFIHAPEIEESKCWNSCSEAMIKLTPKGSPKPPLFTYTDITIAYKTIGNLNIESIKNYELGMKPSDTRYWSGSPIPVTLKDGFWSRCLKKCQVSGSNLTVCHHPLICELSMVKSGHLNKSGKSHTCARPSHLLLATAGFNKMNEGIQKTFGGFILQNAGINETTDKQLVLRVYQMSIEERIKAWNEMKIM